MAAIGIIANPASGKDIRRLVSYATVIDNQEKLNIVKRIVLAAQALGVEEIYFMPDTFWIGETVAEQLRAERALKAKIHILDMPLTASAEDTVVAARQMNLLKLGCVVVLGGDGTSRAAAKGIGDTPMLPVSTGTNNVYPDFVEGTVAGMAAATVARLPESIAYCPRGKRIELYRNERWMDLALIDAVISDDIFVGARAIWNVERIMRIFVTQCHPASIGFSAVAGGLTLVGAEEEFGYQVCLGGEGEEVLAAVGAGVVCSVPVAAHGPLPINQDFSIVMDRNCMIALDGEREQRANKGERWTFRIQRSGPRRVDPRAVLEYAQKSGLLQDTNGRGR